MRTTLPAIAASLTLALALPGSALAAAPSPLDLVGPIADYKLFVSDELDQLVQSTKAFTEAVKAGDLDKARALYAPARIHYEIIEPAAELFSDLDSSIDSRADDHEGREKDPGFAGFHRIEYGLFSQNSTDGLSGYADKLMADVTELDKRIADLTFPPDRVVAGASDLMEEVAASKVSGEEDRYSHADLWDFQANVDGSHKIFELVKPLLGADDKDFVDKVEANFTTVNQTLAKYKVGQGFETYDKLSDDDRRVLAGAVNTLAEDLSTLRGKLGLS
jgi:iron uptake system component EfeO